MQKLIPLFLALLLSTSLFAAGDPEGIRPLGANGKPLNLDFEDGTLKDWTATGTAFAKQPVKGDTVAKRRPDMKSRHQGDYWIGSYETTGGDAAMGTLTSAPFKAVYPWASFLIAGGKTTATKVEVMVKDGEKERAVFRASGEESETMQRALVNLTPYLDKEIYIRITDNSAEPWGHVNFDDFRFYEKQPLFASGTVAPEKKANPLPVDNVKFAGLSPEDAAKEITLPKGFKATLFAGEPDVVQPIAFCIDDRGRLWVVEGMTYPKRQPEGEGKDRILVFEDTDGDGKFDKRTVFMEKMNLVSGIEVGFGGVWIGAAPYLMFVPVKDWDNPKPAGETQILLDGWDFARDTHETLNTFTWGPDGWLYGCHGVFCPSNVGKPGTPTEQRQWVDAAVWRYHPSKHQFEVFAEGTSNPWGVDFDEKGQCIIEACVIPHLFHMIQGGKYTRQGGAHYAANVDERARFAGKKEGKSDKTVNPYVYDEIKTIADHRHYLGDQGPHAANGRSDAAGGGHAHAGLLVYQGDSFPAEYRGKLFMNNIHGARINMDVPERAGSGFVGKHGADFINFNDKWSQIINLLSGPDGSVFMIDWYDKNQCHHNDVNGHDRSNGRIFKISYGDKKAANVDLAKLSDDELIKLVPSQNEFMSRHARRVLQERHFVNPGAVITAAPFDAQTLKPRLAIIESLTKMLHDSSDVRVKLRALWALRAVSGISSPLVMEQLQSNEEYVRAWTIQFAFEDTKNTVALLKECTRLAREDKSPVVRLYLASALQRLPVAQRGEILEALIAHAEDAADQNLPLMYWYAAEPLVGESTTQAIALLGKAKIPKLREFITKRMAAASAEKKTASAK